MDEHTSMDACTQSLELLVRGMSDAFAHLGHVDALSLFIERNGKLWRGRSLPSHYKRGPSKECFRNAALLAVNEPRLAYVEGYGLRAGLALPIHHAWCVDEEDAVVDVTWSDPEHCAYYGVRFVRAMLVDALIQNEVYGILDTGRGPNVALMCALDAGMSNIITARRANAMAVKPREV